MKESYFHIASILNVGTGSLHLSKAVFTPSVSGSVDAGGDVGNGVWEPFSGINSSVTLSECSN